MKIKLRLKKVERKNNFRKVETIKYVSEGKEKVTFLPIPSWLRDNKCSCGKPATFMTNDMKLVCFECINKTIRGKNRLIKKTDISFPITKYTITNLLFEWSVTTRDQWYFLKGTNIKSDNWKKLLKNIKQLLIDKKPILLDGEYDKDKKEMTIY